MNFLRSFWKTLLDHDWIAALLLALLVIALLVMTADEAPQWIYQGF